MLYYYYVVFELYGKESRPATMGPGNNAITYNENELVTWIDYRSEIINVEVPLDTSTGLQILIDHYRNTYNAAVRITNLKELEN